MKTFNNFIKQINEHQINERKKQVMDSELMRIDNYDDALFYIESDLNGRPIGSPSHYSVVFHDDEAVGFPDQVVVKISQDTSDPWQEYADWIYNEMLFNINDAARDLNMNTSIIKKSYEHVPEIYFHKQFEDGSGHIAVIEYLNTDIDKIAESLQINEWSPKPNSRFESMYTLANHLMDYFRRGQDSEIISFFKTRHPSLFLTLFAMRDLFIQHFADLKLSNWAMRGNTLVILDPIG